MQTQAFVQGSQAWHTYRAAHFNASDAPAMLGYSPYRSRNELLLERFTGASKEVDIGTQMRFDDGHRFEALARPIAEGLVGCELYPVTGSLGEFSASFDGITMDGDVVWEHKTLNDEIRAAESAEHLGAHYRVQMEQQLLVSGAARCLFLATKWDSTDRLIDSRHFWYESSESLRAEIIAGWAQFATDLAAYEPRVIPATPVAESIMQLPALSIQIRGEVTVSNLPVFKAKADQFIASIKTDLLTDEDFANAEETIKFCDKAEKDLEHAKAAAIAQTASIDELMRTVDHISAQLRDKRLLLTRTVKDKKELLKASILSKAKLRFSEYVAALELEIAPLRLVYSQPDFAGAMKNKRTLATLHDAVDTEMANAKIAIGAIATAVRARLNWYNTTACDYQFSFADLQTIIQKADDDFKMLVNSRIAKHQADEARIAEAKRIERIDDAINALREGITDAHHICKTSEAVRQEIAYVEAKIISAEIYQERHAEAMEVQATVLASMRNILADRVSAEAVQATTSDAQVAFVPGLGVPQQILGVTSLPVSPKPTTPPSLRLGQINERIAPLSISADGLRSLGFEPAGRDKAAVLYHESDFQMICAAMTRHITAIQTNQKAA